LSGLTSTYVLVPQSLPSHTRKVTGSIPVGTTRNAEVSSCLVGWSPLAIAFIRQNPPWVDLPLDYLKVRRGTGTAPHSTCGHRRRPETVESGIGDGGGGVVNELGYETRRHCRGGGETRRYGSDGRLILSCERILRGDWRHRCVMALPFFGGASVIVCQGGDLLAIRPRHPPQGDTPAVTAKYHGYQRLSMIVSRQADTSGLAPGEPVERHRYLSMKVLVLMFLKSGSRRRPKLAHTFRAHAWGRPRLV
jgi:hypothetical protein